MIPLALEDADRFASDFTLHTWIALGAQLYAAGIFESRGSMDLLAYYVDPSCFGDTE